MTCFRTIIAAGIGAGLLLAAPQGAIAAELPAHSPLRVLVISDEVNPNGLSSAELTQPGDVSAAIGNPGSGIEIESIDEVSSQCIDDALALLAEPGSLDVVIYFAHLSALDCSGNPRQAELTSGLERHLQMAGGVVVFHHGIYEAAGKEQLLQLLGGTAGSIEWNTSNGQDVIAVAPDHFVTTQGLSYAGMRSFAGAGVDEGDYPFFNNTPDERYPNTSLLTAGGESRTILFASANADGGAARVLGYDLHRSGWMGHVVLYQPGEYQPHALDDLDGPNFQILANAIYYAATTLDDGNGDTGGDTEGPGDSSGGVDESGDPPATDDGMPPDETSGGGTTGGDTSAAQDGGGGGDEGCGCRTTGRDVGTPWLLMLAALGLTRRRRGSVTA